MRFTDNTKKQIKTTIKKKTKHSSMHEKIGQLRCDKLSQKCWWRCVHCSSKAQYRPACTSMYREHNLSSNLCERRRIARPARYANINKPVVSVSGQAHFLSYHLVLAWKPAYLAGLLWFYVCKYAHRSTFMYVLCASNEHTLWDRVNKNTHLVPFRIPEILCLLGSDYFLSPHAGCAGEEINFTTQHNA